MTKQAIFYLCATAIGLFAATAQSKNKAETVWAYPSKEELYSVHEITIESPTHQPMSESVCRSSSGRVKDKACTFTLIFKNYPEANCQVSKKEKDVVITCSIPFAKEGDGND